MYRALHVPVTPVLAMRVVASLLALVFLLALEGPTPTTVSAGTGGDSVAATRRAQVRAEQAMLRADKRIKKLKSQSQHRGSRYRAARQRVRLLERKHRAAIRQSKRSAAAFEIGSMQLARKLRVHPNPAGVQIPDKPRLRKQVRTLEQKASKAEWRTKRLSRQIKQARRQLRTRSFTKAEAKRRIQARKAARERAEAKLGSAITTMLSLSKERADARFSSLKGKRLKKPARGHISQRYGCQSVKRSRSRTRCARFHDGVDIATARGSRVRASAPGYVAYVGRNPWDTGSRAFVVIVGHAGGYETIYGHLKPVAKVRSGQLVRRGQVIGRVGVTGHTTGPHVHWELSRDFKTIDPLRFGR